MKISKILFAFSPLAFFCGLAGNASAQVVVLNPGAAYCQAVVPPVHCAPGYGYPVYANHYPYGYGYCQQPAVFVGPQVVRYSNGDFAGGYVSGYGGGFASGTPGVTRVHTGSRGLFGGRTGIVSNLDSFGFGSGPVSSVSSTHPRATVPSSEWMMMGAPVGGPVGTWFEDAATPGNVYQYTVRADGTYEMFELRKNASGPMVLVTKVPARTSFSFENEMMVLNPGGAYEEGPFAVSMSGNALGDTRVTLRDAETGKLRVWRTAP